MALARGLLARQGVQNVIRGRSALPASAVRAASSPTTAATTAAVGIPTAIAMRNDLPEDKFMGVLPRRAEGDTGASTPLLMPQRGYEGDSPRERIAMMAAADAINRQREAADSGLLDRANFHDENAVPNPQRSLPAARMPLPVPRPAALDSTPQQSLLSRIFSGQDYQSSNALASDPRMAGYSARVVQDGKVNYGDRDNAADFFRADAARMAMEKKAAEEGEGKAKGGAVAGKDAALHEALEIIHHLLTRGH